MAPSIAQLETPLTETDEQFQIPPAKKRKLTQVLAEDEINAAKIPPHPLGVKPLGNVYTAVVNLKDSCGVFVKLPDELILQVLEYLPARSLVHVGATCKALYAFTRAEDLWKTLFIAQPPEHFLNPADPSPPKWHGTWRATYLSLPPNTNTTTVSCEGLYSDALYRPHFCAHVPLEPYTRNIPWRNQLPRLDDLTATDFNADWADKPFILTSPVKSWPAYRDWSLAKLVAAHGRICFTAEAVTWPLSTYMSYMRDCPHDESPLYLFDAGFASKMNLPPGTTSTMDTSTTTALTATPPYTPPAPFADLLSHLGTQRPDHAWLILGPARSGSTFHQDPNRTSAWNAVLHGLKYWLLFPPSSTTPPPGVFTSADRSHVTAPLSIAEYLVGWHAVARAAPGCREALCGPGEVLHVPAGWWHLVLNVEPGVAVTQNFVAEAGLAGVLWFLRERADQVSGFAEEVEDPYKLVVERLEAAMPGLVRRVEEAQRTKKKGVWERVRGREEGGEEEEAFSFGLCGSGEESDDEDWDQIERANVEADGDGREEDLAPSEGVNGRDVEASALVEPV